MLPARGQEPPQVNVSPFAGQARQPTQRSAGQGPSSCTVRPLGPAPRESPGQGPAGGLPVAYPSPSRAAQGPGFQGLVLPPEAYLRPSLYEHLGLGGQPLHVQLLREPLALRGHPGAGPRDRQPFLRLTCTDARARAGQGREWKPGDRGQRAWHGVCAGAAPLEASGCAGELRPLEPHAALAHRGWCWHHGPRGVPPAHPRPQRGCACAGSRPERKACSTRSKC